MSHICFVKGSKKGIDVAVYECKYHDFFVCKQKIINILLAKITHEPEGSNIIMIGILSVYPKPKICITEHRVLLIAKTKNTLKIVVTKRTCKNFAFGNIHRLNKPVNNM